MRELFLTDHIYVSQPPNPTLNTILRPLKIQ